MFACASNGHNCPCFLSQLVKDSIKTLRKKFKLSFKHLGDKISKWKHRLKLSYCFKIEIAISKALQLHKNSLKVIGSMSVCSKGSCLPLNLYGSPWERL